MTENTSFINDGREYVIETPHAPRPLWNYFANSEYHTKFSQTAQGISMAYSPREKTVTRDGRYFYIKDRSTDECYNPNYLPLGVMPDKYECHHKAESSEIISETSGIRTKIRMFLPLNGKFEIWRVCVENLRSDSAELDLFSVFALNSPGMASRCVFEKERRLFHSYAFPYHVKYAEYADKNTEDNYTYLYASEQPDSVDCGELRFFMSDNHSELPFAVKQGRCSDCIAENDKPLAAAHNALSLRSGEARSFYYILGCARDISQIRERIDTIGDIPVWAEREYEASKSFWQKNGEGFRIETPDAELDRFVNCWLAKQITVMNITHRFEELSCVRNELQDAVGYSIFAPSDGLAQLEKVLRLQEADGNLKQWHIVNNTSPIRRLGLLTYYDGPIWLILCACTVIERGGDISVFEKQIEFADGSCASIYEHIMRAVQFLGRTRGAHNLVLFADGDWTDPLNGMGGKGRGETVWGSQALLYAAGLFAKISALLGRTDDERYLAEYCRVLDDAINMHCWDGDWYILGFNDDGERVGTSADAQGKIFLNAQTWAVISGAARGERLEKVVNTIKSIDTPCGPMVNYPPFEGWNKNAGRVSLKLSGTTENGAVYCHAVMFWAYAQCILGDFCGAYDTIKRTLPENEQNPSEKSMQSPTFVPNYYYGLVNSPNFGISSNVYSTGTASWLMWIAAEQILGVRAGFYGVTVKPNLPQDWQSARIRKSYRGAEYDICIKRNGVRSIAVDGEMINCDTLPYENGRIYTVNITV